MTSAGTYLSFSRMPWLLRLLALLSTADGAFRIGRWLLAMLAGEPARLGSLGTGLVCVTAGVQLLRGRREGIDWVLLYGLVQIGLLSYAVWRSGALPDAKRSAAIAGLVAMIAYLVWCRVRLSWHERASYGHWMSDPDFRSSVAARFAERDRVLAQDRRDPPDPDAVVRSLLDGDDAKLVGHRIQAAPQHFGLAVLRALGDPAFRRNKPVLAMLVDHLPEALRSRAREQLVTCLDHLVGRKRGNVLRMLAATGDAALSELLVRELTGPGYSSVAEGLAEALVAGRAGEELRRAVEPALRACLARPKVPVCVSVALAHIDSNLPRQLIADAATFANEPLQALAALGDSGLALPDDEVLALWRRIRDASEWFWCWRLLPFVAVPEAELRALLAELPRHCVTPPSSPDAGPQASAAQYACRCYARAVAQLVKRGSSDAEQLLEQAIAMDLEDVSDDAAAELMHLHGVPGDLTFSDRTKLTPPQRALRCLCLASRYAGNGGMLHAFECFDAEDMRALEPALAEIAPPEVRDIWLAALREISPKPLPTAHAERVNLIMARYDQVAQRVDELDRQWRQWKLDVAMARYAITHRDKLTAPG